MSRIRIASVLCLMLACTLAVPALAQDVTHISKGRVMFANNDTIIVHVTEGENLGMHKFTVREAEERNVKFYDRDGNEMIFADIRKDDMLAAVRVEHHEVAHAVISEEELDEHIATAETSTASSTATEPSPAASAPVAPMPTTLPKTASPLPLVGLLGLVFLGLAAGLRSYRRAQG